MWVSERDLAQPGDVRLFCLPHAGSGAAGFYRWRTLLPAAIAVCPVQLPGREARMREPALTSATEIIHQLHGSLQAELDKPYAIFGHSMGALLAYEWALRIHRQGGRAPELLIVSGRNAPSVPPGHGDLHTLGDDALVQGLAERYGSSAAAVLADEEMRALFLPVLRADLAVVERYKPGPMVPGPMIEPMVEPLTCRLLATAGVQDISVTTEGLKRWAQCTSGEFSSRQFEGDHFYPFSAGQRALLTTMAGLLT